MDRTKVISLNVRGIRNTTKRRRVFRYLKQSNADICLLQEVHSSAEDNALWQAEFGNKIIFANKERNAGGMAILFLNKTGKFKNDLILRDVQGRYIIYKIEINETEYVIGNVYGPNDDDPQFYRNFFEEVNKVEAVHMIIGGDFNIALDPDLDCKEPKVYNPRAREEILNFMEGSNCKDIWRVKNPEIRRLTWSKLHPIQWSHIDYFLVSDSLLNFCTEVNILSCTISDHSVVTVEFETETTPRGPGHWKLNEELLNEDNYVTRARELIRELKQIYGHLDAFDRWELVKFGVEQYSRDYSKNKAQNDQNEQKNLYKLLSLMQQRLIDKPKKLLIKIKRIL